MQLSHVTTYVEKLLALFTQLQYNKNRRLCTKNCQNGLKKLKNLYSLTQTALGI